MSGFKIDPEATYFIDTNIWLLKASQIRDIHNFSFWDSIVAASALDCDANYLISEDMQNGFLLGDRLKIVNPFASITTIRKA